MFTKFFIPKPWVFIFWFYILLLCDGSLDSNVLNANPIEVSGVYPHLTMWNNEDECGTGALVPWQGSLWAITYAPHKPGGSSDKLYEITEGLHQKIFNDSVGGTPANRMIHKESNQLIIGSYLIDSQKNIRVIPQDKMFGRLTANARHLDDPQNLIYYATMEEGLYQVNVKTLEVECLIRDGNGGAPKIGRTSKLPGYHGKGMYSGQDQLIYANNGERHPNVSKDPTLASGALATWVKGGDWQLIRRNQFTEVTGPGGIYGNQSSDQQIWSMGWDEKSLILALLDNGVWNYYRLPKASHSYDGSHGWNTEWPRIRDIGEKDLLATMHGTFWKFPKSFSRMNSKGIKPRSNYLKVIGDFCNWNGMIVMGCDDSARAEFLNKRSFKAENGSPKQSNSNLWFIKPNELDTLGPAIGRGSVWLEDDLNENEVSDPYLFSGYDHRQISISHNNAYPVSLILEVDKNGDNKWTQLEKVTIPANKGYFKLFSKDTKGTWIRAKTVGKVMGLSVHFNYRNHDSRNDLNSSIFDGIAKIEDQVLPRNTGLMRSLSHKTLGLVASNGDSPDFSDYFHLDQKLKWSRVDDSQKAKQLVKDVSQPLNVYKVDKASVIVEEDGKRYRLPRNDWYAFTDEPTEVSSVPEQKSVSYHVARNLALGAKVKSSSVFTSNGPGKAVDGKLTDSSRWLTSGSDNNKFIEIQFKQPQEFQYVWIFSGWQNGKSSWGKQFSLEVQLNGQWTALASVSGNNTFRRELKLPQTVTAKNIRITSDDEGHLRVYEVAVFAEKPEVEEPPKFKFSTSRVCREVATERDLLNIHGTFYELPAKNAQGLAKVRPVATHNLDIHDFCSHNGLLFLSGISPDAESSRIFKSPDGKAMVWAGVVDDLWKLGKPSGIGGPWKDSTVKANAYSDPYLMTGFDQKEVKISANSETTINLQVDIDGTGIWVDYKAFNVKPGQIVTHKFQDGFSAYWVRVQSSNPSRVSVEFLYH